MAEQNIFKIASRLGLSKADLEPQGDRIAKIKLPLKNKKTKQGRLILVTAITPTRFGEGKTTMSIGLADALSRLGKKAMLCLREPSLGPVFSQKGGAAGGGLAKIVPSEEINLHFTGDIHAITSVHNLIAAEIDNHIFWGNRLEIDEVYWKRAIDLCDRGLRKGFMITAASEVMAILCLAGGAADLKKRLEEIVVGKNKKGNPVKVKDLNISDNLARLLARAIMPNLVQTGEGAPALVHGGPFANIAHGTSSLIAARAALGLADYVIIEAGFGSDLGGFKFFDIAGRIGKIRPRAVALVATVRALKECGMENLGRHAYIIRRQGITPVVAINRFNDDKKEDLEAIKAYCRKIGVPAELSEAFKKGGKGNIALAKAILKSLEAKTKTLSVYPLSDPLEVKIGKVNREVFGGEKIDIAPVAREKLELFAKWGYGGLPVCIAKTQYSLSDDKACPRVTGGFTLKVTDAALSAGAGFVVVQCGGMLTMPGMPDKSQKVQKPKSR